MDQCVFEAVHTVAVHTEVAHTEAGEDVDIVEEAVLHNEVDTDETLEVEQVQVEALEAVPQLHCQQVYHNCIATEAI